MRIPFNTQGRDIDGLYSEIEDEEIALAGSSLPSKTIGDSDNSSGRLVRLSMIRTTEIIVVLRSMRAAMTQAVSTPRERGATSRRSRPWVFSEVSPKRRNDGLANGTVSDSLIGVDGLAGLLVVKEIKDKLDGIGNANGRTDKDAFVNTCLADLRIAENLLDGLESGVEEVLAELLETGTSE